MRTLAIVLLCCYLGTAQQTEIVDFLKVEGAIEAVLPSKLVKGVVKYHFKVLRRADSIYLDAIQMRIIDTALEGPEVLASDNKIWLIDSFEANKEYVVFFEFEAYPKQTVYFFEDQIWTQGQGKYTSHWLPSIDDMNDKIEFDLTYKIPDDKINISNGKLVSIAHQDGMAYWKWDMDHPMSSYLVAFVIGNFDSITEFSGSQIPIELYIDPLDELCVEPTYRYSKEIFDFMEKEIGVPYPWQNYKQVPVRDFLYAGMENTTATVFSKSFVVDSIGFNDRNYVYVNAHELAHQWFGNLVTETDGKHHWLHEGFATYYALLAEKEIFGEDHFYWKLMQSAEQLQEISDDGRGESLLDPKASSLTFYEKGAWALHILKEIVGASDFNKAVKLFLTNHAYDNVRTQDFLSAIQSVTKVDISNWEQEWLLQNTFNSDEVMNSLKRSSFVKRLLSLRELREIDLMDKKEKLLEAVSDSSDRLVQEVIYQVSNTPISDSREIYEKGFKSNSVSVRQTIALTMESIPEELRLPYESLLNDDSYLTKEVALYNLWVNFPEHRTHYLDLLKDVEGFQDKNIRQLWLTLALLTDRYRTEDKSIYFKELKDYSSSIFSFEVRQIAIGYLIQLEWIDQDVLVNMLNATTHPTWRFRQYVRNELKKLLLDTTYRQMALEVKESLTSEEMRYLSSLLEMD